MPYSYFHLAAHLSSTQLSAPCPSAPIHTSEVPTQISKSKCSEPSIQSSSQYTAHLSFLSPTLSLGGSSLSLRVQTWYSAGPMYNMQGAVLLGEQMTQKGQGARTHEPEALIFLPIHVWYFSLEQPPSCQRLPSSDSDAPWSRAHGQLQLLSCKCFPFGLYPVKRLVHSSLRVQVRHALQLLFLATGL